MTIFIGGMVTIPSHGFMTWFLPIIWIKSWVENNLSAASDTIPNGKKTFGPFRNMICILWVAPCYKSLLKDIEYQPH